MRDRTRALILLSVRAMTPGQIPRKTMFTNSANETPIGLVTVGKTVYQVFRLEVGENSKRCGVAGNYALRGPKGAWYFVTDLGKRYRLNVTACGGATPWTPSPSAIGNLRNLQRSDLAPFGVEV